MKIGSERLDEGILREYMKTAHFGYAKWRSLGPMNMLMDQTAYLKYDTDEVRMHQGRPGPLFDRLDSLGGFVRGAYSPYH